MKGEYIMKISDYIYFEKDPVKSRRMWILIKTLMALTVVLGIVNYAKYFIH